MSRGERRHHEERVKAKWRKRARRWENPSSDQLAWKRIALGPKGRVRVLNKDAAAQREKRIEERAVRRAHHNKCPCSLCKNSGPFDRARLPKPKERGGHDPGAGG